MSELQDIRPGKYSIELGGKTRYLRYGFEFWANIEEQGGDIKSVFKDIETKPINALPGLIAGGIAGEKVSTDEVRGWLNEFETLNDLMPVLNIVKAAMIGSQPEIKEGKNPPKAKK